MIQATENTGSMATGFTMTEDNEWKDHGREFRVAVSERAAVLVAATALADRRQDGTRTATDDSNQPGGEMVPHRPLGKTGLQVSAIGVGGYHLGSAKNQQDANEIVAQAMDAGVNFFDNAWDYHDGQSEEWLGIALKGKRDKVVLMTKVCTHGRGKDVAMQQLEAVARASADRSS